MADERERKFPCSVCGKEITTLLPPADIANRTIFSTLVMVHPDPVVCPHCGQEYDFVLKGIRSMDMLWASRPPKLKPEEGIIEVPEMSALDFEKLKMKRN